MRPFAYDARRRARPRRRGRAGPAGAQFLAGGTTLLDLMKLDVMRPGPAGRHQRAWRAARAASSADGDGLRLGALVRMARGRRAPASCAATIRWSPRRWRWPPAPQLRNMATPRRQRAAAHPLPLLPRRRRRRLQQARARLRLRGARRRQPHARGARHAATMHRDAIPATSREALVALDADGARSSGPTAAARIAVRGAAPPARRHAAASRPRWSPAS